MLTENKSRWNILKPNKNEILMKFALLITIAMYVKVFATAQIPDVLIYKNDTLKMQANPLDQFFIEHPEMKPKSSSVSSANWRGYTASWIIKDSLLILNDIFISNYDLENNNYSKKSVFHSVFSNSDQPVYASWYSGYLLLPTGKMLKYIHMGYSSEYDKYIFMKIKKGKIVELSEKSNTDIVHFRKSQFDMFKKTKDYIDNLGKLKKDSTTKDIDLDTFMLLYLTDELLKDFESK
jgi:hypothetical protein